MIPTELMVQLFETACREASHVTWVLVANDGNKTAILGLQGSEGAAVVGVLAAAGKRANDGFNVPVGTRSDVVAELLQRLAPH